jgi:hypothetical protein
MVPYLPAARKVPVEPDRAEHDGSHHHCSDVHKKLLRRVRYDVLNRYVALNEGLTNRDSLQESITAQRRMDCPGSVRMN